MVFEYFDQYPDKKTKERMEMMKETEVSTFWVFLDCYFFSTNLTRRYAENGSKGDSEKCIYKGKTIFTPLY